MEWSFKHCALVFKIPFKVRVDKEGKVPSRWFKTSLGSWRWWWLKITTRILQLTSDYHRFLIFTYLHFSLIVNAIKPPGVCSPGFVPVLSGGWGEISIWRMGDPPSNNDSVGPLLANSLFDTHISLQKNIFWTDFFNTKNIWHYKSKWMNHRMLKLVIPAQGCLIEWKG